MTFKSGVIYMQCATSAGTTVNCSITVNPVTGAVRNVNGVALTVTNNTGGSAPVVLIGQTSEINVTVQPGVTTRTAAQLAAVGIASVSDIVGWSLSCP